MVEIKNKIELRDKNDEANLTESTNIHAQLKWTSSVDLDLYTFYLTKEGKEGRVFYGRMSEEGIRLDEDAGVGDIGGDNEENINIESLHNLKHILIVANIYNKLTNFSKYNGSVIVEAGEQQIKVPLTSKTKGSWCVVAHLDNTSPIGAKLINVNKVYTIAPSIMNFINGTSQEAPESPKKGLLGRLFG